MHNGKSTHGHHVYNIVKHLLSNWIIFIDYVKSKENIMDLLTKALLREFDVCYKLYKLDIIYLVSKLYWIPSDTRNVYWCELDIRH